MQALESLFHNFLSQWPDLLWIPVSVFIVHEGQRLKALFFIVICMATLRLQMQIMASTGHDDGFTGWIKMGCFHRGLIVYAFFIAGYLLLSYFSPHTKGPIYLAASLSIFFAAFVTSSFLMIV